MDRAAPRAGRRGDLRPRERGAHPPRHEDPPLARGQGAAGVRARADVGLTIRGVPTTVLIAPDAFKGTLLRARGSRSRWPWPRSRGQAGRSSARSRTVARAHSRCSRRRSGPSSMLSRSATRSGGRCRRGSALADGQPSWKPPRPADCNWSRPRERDPLARHHLWRGRAHHGRDHRRRRDRAAGRRRFGDHRRRLRRHPRRSAHGGGLADARLSVLCDVRTPFEDAARVFGPAERGRPRAGPPPQQTTARPRPPPGARPARHADDRRRGRPRGGPVGRPRG